MYLLHLDIPTVSQNLIIPLTSSSLLCGLTSLLIYSLSSCHIFSIGFKSGDSGGVLHQLIPFSSKYDLAHLEVCFGSLSCMYRCPSSSLVLRNGRSALSKICMNRGAFILPSKTQISVAPCQLIPAHTWTLTGCLALKRKANELSVVCSLH